MKTRLLAVIATTAFALACASIAHALDDAGPDLATEFAREVSPRFALPADEQRVYAELLRAALSNESIFVVVDTQRSARPAWAQIP